MAIQRDPQLAQPLHAALAPVGEVVVAIPAPGGDHREHQHPAGAQQVLISARIALAHVLGRMGEVELDRPAATRLEVDEAQPVPRPEHVAGVRLAVQQLLGGGARADRAAQVAQRGAEEFPVALGELRGAGAVGDQGPGLENVRPGAK